MTQKKWGFLPQRDSMHGPASRYTGLGGPVCQGEG